MPYRERARTVEKDEPVRFPIERPWGLAAALLFPALVPALVALMFYVEQGTAAFAGTVDLRAGQVPVVVALGLFIPFGLVRGGLALYDAVRGPAFVFARDAIVIPRCRLFHFRELRVLRRDLAGLERWKKPRGATIKWAGGARQFTEGVCLERFDDLVRLLSGDRLPDAVGDEELKPIIMGRHLIELGVRSGPLLGQYLEICLEAQRRGTFDTLEGGLDYVKELLAEQRDDSIQGPYR